MRNPFASSIIVSMDLKDREEKKKISCLAAQVMELTRDELLMGLRFLDGAFSKLVFTERFGLERIATDGERLYYDPVTVLRIYRETPKRIARICLHSMLHCVLAHPFGYDHLDQGLWDLSCNISVEAIILELQLSAVSLEEDADLAGALRVLKTDAGALTADKLYRYFTTQSVNALTLLDYRHRFARDDHSFWRGPEKYDMTAEDWQQISRRIRAELKSFSERKAGTDALAQEIDRSEKESFDYGTILRRFLVTGEHTSINEEEYDYIYYTYGLTHYGDMPLIEPLEYREEKKIRDFVIAIDTSASCSGDTVKRFLKKTLDLLGADDFFFSRFNIHIVQCDAEIQSDLCLTSREDVLRMEKEFSVQGFGATDFRPVFSYIEELKEAGEFTDLRGLIYFTDGYGIYPSTRPEYEVVWVFLNEDEYRAPVPLWSTKVVLNEETDLHEQ